MLNIKKTIYPGISQKVTFEEWSRSFTFLQVSKENQNVLPGILRQKQLSNIPKQAKTCMTTTSKKVAVSFDQIVQWPL